MASLLPNGKQQFIDQNGKPLANGSVYYYAPGTTTPQTTWQDSAQTIPNTNPIVLDSNGQALVWGVGTYRQVVTNSLGVQIWDQIVSDGGMSNFAGSQGALNVGFKQNGANAVLRTLDAKARENFTATDFLTIQDAVNAAGANGSVTIPATYAGTDTYSNLNNIAVTDLRHAQQGFWTVLAPSFPVAGYPYGNDCRLRARGPSDLYIEHYNVFTTTNTSLVVGWNNNVPISSVICGNQAITEKTGDATLFSTSAQLVIGRETANEEQVNTGSWQFVDATHINILCTKTHSGTTDIEQNGSTLLNCYDLYISSNVVKPSQNTSYNAPLRVKDLHGNFIALIPSDLQSAFPYAALQLTAIVTGNNGTNNNLLFQNNNSNSQVIWRNSAGTQISALNNAGNLAITAGINTGNAQVAVNGSNAEVVVGRNINATSITSTVDCHILWQAGTDPLNPSGTAGSLGLYGRNIAGTTLNFITQNTWQGSIGSAGLRIVAGFGCNGKAPQAAGVSGGTLAGVIAVLVNNGILSS